MSAGRLMGLDGVHDVISHSLAVWTMEILRIEAVGHTRRWVSRSRRFFLLDTRFRGQDKNVSTRREYRSLHRGHGGGEAPDRLNLWSPRCHSPRGSPRRDWTRSGRSFPVRITTVGPSAW